VSFVIDALSTTIHDGCMPDGFDGRTANYDEYMEEQENGTSRLRRTRGTVTRRWLLFHPSTAKGIDQSISSGFQKMYMPNTVKPYFDISDLFGVLFISCIFWEMPAAGGSAPLSCRALI